MPAKAHDPLRDDAEAVFTKLFLTAEGRADPYPLYHQLRQTAPVHRAKLGMWLLSRYDDCWAAMRDPRLGKDYAPQIEQRFGPDWRKHPSLTAGEHSMLNTSGPEHTRLRKLVTKSFTPRMIENLKPVIERVVNQLLDPVADAGGGNVLEAVGFPLPVTIIGEMLGVPEADRPQFRDLVRDLVAIFEMQPTPAQLVSVDAAQVTGVLRSFQGVNLGPLHTQTNFPDLTAQYRALRIDAIRTHDFFGPTDLDAHPRDRGHEQVIFPDWSADPAKADSYRFGPSDRMVKGIVDCSARPCFRLGRSFGADPTPPPDFEKFAEVAKHIVMHYNGGCANGYHYNIRYWEIWNEPNIEKDWVPGKGLYLFWSGTREQFFDLYQKTARALKALDPSLKVGGPRWLPNSP